MAHGLSVRVAYVTESFPSDVNGVAHTAVRVAESLVSRGHQVLVVAPEPASGRPRPDSALDFPVVRVPSLNVPAYPGFRVGLPGRRVHAAVAGHRADLVHLAGPFVLGAGGCAAARRLYLPVVAVYATDLPGYARARRAVPSALFLGQRDGEHLARIYASLDVFVHSGPHDTFGQTLQEAAASGLPVVAPAAGGPADLVQHGVTGFLVAPGDPAALAGAVAALAADPALRAAQGRAGRRAVLGRSWPVMCDELIGHYQAVLEGAGTRQAEVPA
jgi:glycosyltransferase involved in cell wall biosynthesis